MQAIAAAAHSLAGVPAAPATAAVLAYRLISFWLPTLPAVLIYRMLRHRSWV